MQQALSQRLILLAVFTISCIVVFLLASRDFHYLRQADASPLTPSSAVNKTKPANTTNNQRQFTAGEDNRREQFAKNITIAQAYLSQNKRSANYAVYFADLNYNQANQPQYLFTHNPNSSFAPASIYKVPLAMLVLKTSDEGKLDLNTTISHQGKPKTLQTVLELMIQASDNDAMSIFESRLGGYNTVQTRIKADFKAQVVRIGQQTTASDVAQVLTFLYQNPDNYLKPMSQQYLISLMQTSLNWQRDRIPAAVNSYNQENQSQLTTASKIGNLTGVYQDAALIQGGQTDYVLVILNKNRKTNSEAINEIHFLTKTLLEGME